MIYPLLIVESHGLHQVQQKYESLKGIASEFRKDHNYEVHSTHGAQGYLVNFL